MTHQPFTRRLLAGIALAAAGTLTLASCGSEAAPPSSDEAPAVESYRIGINQLVQHPALDAATEGFRQAFADAGVEVDFEVQNANGEQPTAVTIAQDFASKNFDLVLAVATPAAQASAQAITDTPVLFTAVTDAVAAQLVDSDEAPGGNVTGVSDLAPVEDHLQLVKEIVPDAAKVGIVYASGEVNSQVQVDAAEAAAPALGLEIVTATVTTANDIQQAAESLGDVDAFYLPTDNLVTSGIAALVQVAESRQVPLIGAESGMVEEGAVAALGIDYFKLGQQTGEMALRILRGADPATTPVELSREFSYSVNLAAAERMGVSVPQSILDQAETVDEE